MSSTPDSSCSRPRRTTAWSSTSTHPDRHAPVSSLIVVPAPGADRTTRRAAAVADQAVEAPQAVVDVGLTARRVEADAVVGHLQDDPVALARTTTDSVRGAGVAQRVAHRLLGHPPHQGDRLARSRRRPPVDVDRGVAPRRPRRGRDEVLEGGRQRVGREVRAGGSPRAASAEPAGCRAASRRSRASAVLLGPGRRPGPARRGRRPSRRGPGRPRRAGRGRSAGVRRPRRWRRCAAAARARRRRG